MPLRIAATWLLLAALAVRLPAQDVPPSGSQPAAPAVPGAQAIRPEEAVQRAQGLRQAGHAAEALDLLKSVLRTSEGNVEANLLAAEILMDANDYDLARNYFKHVLDTEPSNFRANLGSGKIWSANRYWRQACSFLEKAENVAPTESLSEVKRLLAAAYAEMGLVQKGIDKAMEAVEADPSDLDALQSLVQIRQKAVGRDAKQIEAALVDAEKYVQRTADGLARAPLDRAALTRLASAYEMLVAAPPNTGILQAYNAAFYERDVRNEATDKLLPGKGVDSAAVLMRVAEVVRQRSLVAMVGSEHDAILVVETAVSGDYDPKNVKNWEHLLLSYQQLQDLLARLVGPAVYSDTGMQERTVIACRKLLEIDPQNERAQQYLQAVGAPLTTQPALAGPSGE